MTGPESAPWWASDATDGLDPDEDPVRAHRTGRRGAGESASADDARPDGADADEDRTTKSVWWEEAAEALAAAAREAGRARRERGGRAVPPRDHARGPGLHHDGEHDGDICQVCPVCVGLRAIEGSRPELVAHLGEAMRHLTLAARAFVDGAAPDDEDDGGLERIHLDDE